MTAGQEVTVKCTYAMLYDPETEQPLFSLQGRETAGNPFGSVVAPNGKYYTVELSDGAAAYVTDIEQKGRIQQIIAGDRRVLVKQVAVAPALIQEDPVDLSSNKTDKKRLIWLALGAAILLS